MGILPWMVARKESGHHFRLKTLHLTRGHPKDIKGVDNIIAIGLEVVTPAIFSHDYAGRQKRRERWKCNASKKKWEKRMAKSEKRLSDQPQNEIRRNNTAMYFRLGKVLTGCRAKRKEDTLYLSVYQ